MLLLLLAVPAGVVAGWLGGGSLLRLRQVCWRGGTGILGVFAVRAAMAFVVPRGVMAGPQAALWSMTAYWVTYGALVSVAVLNRRLPGAMVFASGAVSNLLAIGAGGGSMPYWIRAAARALGRATSTPRVAFGHLPVAALGGMRYLGDIFPLPGPLASVFSVGDGLIALGTFWMIFRLMVRGCVERRPAVDTE